MIVDHVARSEFIRRTLEVCLLNCQIRGMQTLVLKVLSGGDVSHEQKIIFQNKTADRFSEHWLSTFALSWLLFQELGTQW